MNLCMTNVSVETEDFLIALEKTDSSSWGKGEFSAHIDNAGAFSLACERNGVAIKSLLVRWSWELSPNARFLGDAFERGYGDLGWRGFEPDREMYWSFIACDGINALGFGVKTGAAALCVWRADRHGVTLRLDIRCGMRGVILGARTLKLAELVLLRSEKDERLFEFAKRFSLVLAKTPIFPKTPVFGFNDWYYAYSGSTAATILRDSELCGELARGLPFKPYSIIDSGWEYSNQQASPWSLSTKTFPDMRRLAAEIENSGCLPGIWYRPLLSSERLPHGMALNASRFASSTQCGLSVLDPSLPENLETIRRDARNFKDWGYKLIKHDFTCWDIFGKWAFEMRDDVSSGKWSFSDRSRTTAEIIVDLYSAIKEGADGAHVLACNAIGHLAVGNAHISRVGDDTSGRKWSRTRKMGVNSLAFRASQHKSFFMLDADCAGVTDAIPWRLNAQWIDLLARSGTALFVSADPKAVGEDQKSVLREAFANACREWPLPEPLDWLDGTCPERWKLGDTTVEFNWSE